MRVLLDSNIVINLLDRQYLFLTYRLNGFDIEVSAISKKEVLGFTRLSDAVFGAFKSVFDKLSSHPITNEIIEAAVALRRLRKMSLRDAVIAATARNHCLTLVTRNIRNFQWIPNLIILNPFDDTF